MTDTYDPIETKPYDPIETEPWDDVVARHESLLPEQLEYLDGNSDYYRRKFREWNVDPASITTLEAFREIPFTTKEDERRNQEDPDPDRPLGDHQAVPTERLNRTISSSGTTGKPTYFGLTEADREHWNAVIKRCFHATGIRPEETVIFGVGQTMVPGGTPYFEAMTELGTNVVPAGGGSTERLLDALRDLHAPVLFTTTSHLRYLTERAPEIIDQGVDELPAVKLIGGGGPGIATPEIRNALYEAWDADLVRELMGLGDVIGCLWAECAAEDGMHYCGQGHAHVELIDPDTEAAVPFEAGAEGELVYTPLGREATPLLRYRSGDYVRITGTDCECGRTSPRMQCIGRVDEMLIYKGMNVFPSAIRDVVAEVEGALPYARVTVPDPDAVHFESPIPVTVVLDPDSDRDPSAVVEDAIDRVRSRLKVRIDPQPVARSAIELSEYKTNLVEVDPGSTDA
ncbi:phenylacetate--CoA ligase family protein [Halopenitus persicus]|uniref:Phenylacetate-CoA ligase n=1 Tax=Halopenitus persicus TaxID=1048396 RepID=A0A1H3EJQ6_9EURY|nr:phenylacetate--CoA ligase family protein [Halopenitus persicus]SDX78850.1 phenylacetate-CoA ligase [Halopenitus persicus]